MTCDYNDEKQSRGKIITTFTGSFYATGTLSAHTTENSNENNHLVEGAISVNNMGTNRNSKPHCNVHRMALLNYPLGKIVTYTSTRARTFVNGSNTQRFFMDDENDVTRTAKAEVVNGAGYYAETTESLNVKDGCGFIRKGKLFFAPAFYPTY